MVCRSCMPGLNMYQLYADEHSKEGNQLHVAGKQQSALMNSDGFLLIERSHWIRCTEVYQIVAPSNASCKNVNDYKGVTLKVLYVLGIAEVFTVNLRSSSIRGQYIIKKKY